MRLSSLDKPQDEKDMVFMVVKDPSFQADTSEGSFKIQIKLGRYLDQHPDFVLSLFWHSHFGREFVAT